MIKSTDIIIPFIESGDYEVNVGLKHIKTILKDYEEDYGLELNPDFQRGHVWTEDQQSAYMEFLLKGGQTARVIYFNCPFFSCGTVEDYKKGKYEMPMQCVDGLQRLTSIVKFLDNKVKVCGYYLNDFEDKEVLMRKMCSIRFNVNKLKTRREVLRWYLDFNTGGTIHSEEEISRVKKLL